MVAGGRLFFYILKFGHLTYRLVGGEPSESEGGVHVDLNNEGNARANYILVAIKEIEKQTITN